MKNLKLQARQMLSAIWMFAIESLLGEVTFDEQMDCYWEGHQASTQSPAPRNKYLHPLRRDAFAAGVLMQQSTVTTENPDFPAYGKEWTDELSNAAIGHAQPQLATC
jgi:hypothetical protein